VWAVSRFQVPVTAVRSVIVGCSSKSVGSSGLVREP
jgi:hypothetical protein